MALSIVLLSIGVPSAAAGTYLLMLAVAGFLDRRSSSAPASVTPDSAAPQLAIVVPARDAEALIGRCVASLRAQSYPRDRFRVVVVADNCSDKTAAVARTAAAEVLERSNEEATGRGHALRWAMSQLLAEASPPDAIVVVNADSIAHRDLLTHLGAALAAGADAAQAEYAILDGRASTRSRLAAAGFVLSHRVRQRGRASLGMPAFLDGSGMVLSRGLLTEMPWNAFSSVEDLEFSVNLRLAGFRPRYVPAAQVSGPVPGGYPGLRGQRRRPDDGRWHVVRSRLAPLLRPALRGDRRLVDAAIDLAVPPLGLLSLATVTGGAITAVAVVLHRAAAWSLSPWLLALAAIIAFVLLGLVSAGALATASPALLGSSRFAAWVGHSHARRPGGSDPPPIEAADRSGHGARLEAAGRVEVAGVPIDRVDMTGAVERLRYALVHRRQIQVAAVNTDLLIQAQSHLGLRRVLASCDLNLPDAGPVVWLSRVLGRRLPERVATVDLVPKLVAEAASRGAAVYLVGAEGGSVEAAAAHLSREWPGLRVAGWHPGPRAGLAGDLDDRSDEIVESIRSSDAQVLLVALGDPEQELWIARHRERLGGVSVAVGVGCVFDLWAGGVRRSPAWAERAGLEWLFDALAEPHHRVVRHVKAGAWLLLLTAAALRQRWRRAGA
jgi:exopolysaccharide biosynthesis WecB/TagA/CpsF family protein